MSKAALPALILLAGSTTQPDLPLAPDHLRQFAQVEVPLQPSRPTRRIVHVLDWHFVQREAFEADTPGADYDEHLELVRTIQDGQRRSLESPLNPWHGGPSTSRASLQRTWSSSSDSYP